MYIYNINCKTDYHTGKRALFSCPASLWVKGRCAPDAKPSCQGSSLETKSRRPDRVAWELTVGIPSGQDALGFPMGNPHVPIGILNRGTPLGFPLGVPHGDSQHTVLNGHYP